MKRASSLLLFAALLALSACKGHIKKILVYASDNITVDNTQKNITVANGDGTTHHEQELEFGTGDPVTLNIKTPQGTFKLTAPDDGLYIANVKTDTVVGSKQHVGTTEGSDRISQDAAKQKLDSLEKLTRDQNVSEANQNYFIAPGQIVKITSETNAKVFGPFTSIPSTFDAGSVPAIYKFYSMKEMREIIDNLQKATGGSSSADSTSKK